MKLEQQRLKEQKKQEKKDLQEECARLRLAAKEIRLQQQQSKAIEREEARIAK
ncbi:hypothetical protein CC80DRAFT_596128 [Byssothecium circinans]|uniref:Uncharacterized protein n=1 Tax=Byssothecium circinans TaxID=147558 RepID=A0A6A5TKS4_9PLEO|nr:hypothetical protein CC80DRAFT_596128 [Byssothecium circinans]